MWARLASQRIDEADQRRPSRTHLAHAVRVVVREPGGLQVNDGEGGHCELGVLKVVELSAE